ncbi:hypothetical protein SAY86_025437 [Trapa natans]|uniref:Uncharacterized protein n=1 Tax=Trapa natans TaxID=22666 RepID=A0AAN7RE40_TRANT|nr:hypothetical protein SAY86_025437 [Trapa natans]
MASGTVASGSHPADQLVEEETTEIKLVKYEEVVHKEDGTEEKKEEVEAAKDILTTKSEGLVPKTEVVVTKNAEHTVPEVLEAGGVPQGHIVATAEEKDVFEAAEQPPRAAEPSEIKPGEKAEAAILSKIVAEKNKLEEKVEANEIGVGSIVKRVEHVKETAEAVKEELIKEAIAELSEKVEAVEAVATDMVSPEDESTTIDEELAAEGKEKNEPPTAVAVVSEVAQQVKENMSKKIEGSTEEPNLAEKTPLETKKVEGVEKKEDPVKDEMPAGETEASHDLPVEEVPGEPTKQSGSVISKLKQSLIKMKKAITGKSSPRSKTLNFDAKEGEQGK